jgi:hypothetical protein
MAIRIYHDFVIFAYNVEVNTHGEVQRFTVRVFSSPIGEGEEEEVVETPDYSQLKLRARELERREMDEDVERQMEMGERLGQLLLPENYARRLFLRSLDWLQPDEGLRLRLRLPKELSDLPWEYMLVQKVGGERKPSDFVTLDSRISIVRHEALAIPARWFEPTDSRRVLVVMASPQPFEDYPRLEHLPDEQRFIKEALDDVSGVIADFEPDFGEGLGEGLIPSAQSRDISSALREGADIFHFSGHGEFVKRVGPSGDGIIGAGGIILADENNQAVAVSADRLLEIIRHHGVRLVVMGACETARRDTVYDWSSVALSLLKGEIPAVIAMQFTVKDPLTARFMGDFYQALSAGLTIDEAVYLGRWAIREMTQLEKPDIRDWGAPVLYMRTPGGSIFPPVTEEVARQRAQDRANGRFQVHQTSYRWMDRGGTASRDELQDLEGRRAELGLEPTQALLLLRSAVAADTSEKPWLDELRQEKGEQLIRHLDDPEPERPTGPEGTLRVLGLDPGTLADRPKQIGPVAWSAADNEDSVTRRTAALSLLALEPTPSEGLGRLERALDTVKGLWARWKRGAELRGTLVDADPEVEEQTGKFSLLDRFGAWLWRVWRRALRDRDRIFAHSLGGALGAGLALGVWRALIAAVGRSQWPIYLFIHSYLGAILGLFTALGMILAESTLLHRREGKPQPTRVARRAALLGFIFFGFWHFITALLNALDLAVRPWMPLTGLLVGVGLGLALYDQPRSGRRLGMGGWLLRLGVVALTAALAQAIIFWVGGNYEATSISFDANYYWQHYRRYDVIRLWMDNTLGWEQAVMIVDTVLAGLVLALGMTLGLAASPRWLTWWRRTTGGDERKSKEGV